MSKDEVKGHYLPEEIMDENARNISELTFTAKSPLWMHNMGCNMTAIINGKNLLDLQEIYKQHSSAIVIGGGPSIEKYRHLELLASSKYKGLILCCDRMLLPLLNNNVIPDIVGTVDGDPNIAKFYDDPLVDKYVDRVKAVFCANSVHPDTVKRWKGETYWFITIWDDPLKNPKSATRLLHFMTGKMMLNCGGNIGTTLWNIAYFLGRNPICLIGMDLGYGEEVDLTQTPYYLYFNKMVKGDQEKLARWFRKGYNPHFKNYYYTDIMFDAYRGILQTMIDVSSKTGLRTINASEQGSLHEGRVKCMKFKQFLRKYSR